MNTRTSKGRKPRKQNQSRNVSRAKSSSTSSPSSPASSSATKAKAAKNDQTPTSAERHSVANRRPNDLVLDDMPAGPSSGQAIIDQEERDRHQAEMLQLALHYEEMNPDEELPYLTPTRNNIAEMLADEDQDWEVEKVLDKRNNPESGEPEYLLKWKNWQGSPTWEPVENCNCKVLVTKFEQERSKPLQQAEAPLALPSPRSGKTPTKRARKGPGSSSSSSAKFSSSSSTSSSSISSSSESSESSAGSTTTETGVDVVQSEPPKRPSNGRLQARRSPRKRPNSHRQLFLSQQNTSTQSMPGGDRRRSARVQEVLSKRVIAEITIDSTASSGSDDRSEQPRLAITSGGDDVHLSNNNFIDTDDDILMYSPPADAPDPSPELNIPSAMSQSHLSSSDKSPRNSAQLPLNENRRPATAPVYSDVEMDKGQGGVVGDRHYDELMKRRKLKLDKIIGFVKDSDEILLVVRWKSVQGIEKIPLKVLRRYYSQAILDHMLERIKWV